MSGLGFTFLACIRLDNIDSVLTLETCDVCGCVVAQGFRVMHTQWHAANDGPGHE